MSRSLKKGPFIAYHLLKKIDKMKEKNHKNNNKKFIKITENIQTRRA